MKHIFEQLFKYGFHDTEISSIEDKNLEIKLNFDGGIYILDKNCKETVLSKPQQIVLKIKPCYNSLEQSIEIRELEKKEKYIDYSTLKKYIKKEPFKIWNAYYSNFCNCILFDGGFHRKRVMFSIESIDKIIVRKLED